MKLVSATASPLGATVGVATMTPIPARNETEQPSAVYRFETEGTWIERDAADADDVSIGRYIAATIADPVKGVPTIGEISAIDGEFDALGEWFAQLRPDCVFVETLSGRTAPSLSGVGASGDERVSLRFSIALRGAGSDMDARTRLGLVRKWMIDAHEVDLEAP